jgi:hypothetical protein
MLQWLGYNKELERLVVETTANQVCEILGSQKNAMHSSEAASCVFLSVYRTLDLFKDAIT